MLGCSAKWFLTLVKSCGDNWVRIRTFRILHSEFLSNLRLPWKTEGVLNWLYWMYIMYYSRFLSNLRLHWKTDLPWNFSLYWNMFYYSGYLRNLRLPWKQSLPWNFQARGGGRPHASYAYAHVLSFAYRGGLRKWRAHCSTVGLHFVRKHGNKPAKVHFILRYSRRFVPWGCWTHTSWQVMQRDSDMLIAVSHVGLRLYFV